MLTVPPMLQPSWRCECCRADKRRWSGLSTADGHTISTQQCMQATAHKEAAGSGKSPTNLFTEAGFLTLCWPAVLRAQVQLVPPHHKVPPHHPLLPQIMLFSSITPEASLCGSCCEADVCRSSKNNPYDKMHILVPVKGVSAEALKLPSQRLSELRRG